MDGHVLNGPANAIGVRTAIIGGIGRLLSDTTKVLARNFHGDILEGSTSALVLRVGFAGVEKHKFRGNHLEVFVVELVEGGIGHVLQLGEGSDGRKLLNVTDGSRSDKSASTLAEHVDANALVGDLYPVVGEAVDAECELDGPEEGHATIDDVVVLLIKEGGIVALETRNLGQGAGGVDLVPRGTICAGRWIVGLDVVDATYDLR